VNRPIVVYLDHEDESLGAVASALREGFQVFVARNAGQAFEAITEVGAAADVFVVDLAPGAWFMGDAVIREFRRLAGREVPVVVVSATERAREVANSSRSTTFLPKPIEVLELVRAIRRVASDDRSQSSPQEAAG
jgi:DNA-binding response OmpR family regulator